MQESATAFSNFKIQINKIRRKIFNNRIILKNKFTSIE